jgi:flagellin-like protein
MSACRSREHGRGQADVVGVLLLTAFVVVSAGTLGTFYLASSVEQASPTATTDVGVDAVHRGGTTTVTVSHRLGEPLDDGRLIVESVGKTDEYALPDPFDEGATWTTVVPGTPPGVRLHVLVVENATGTVVFDGQFAVQTPGPTATPAPAYGTPTKPPEADDPSGDGEAATPTTTPTSTATPTSDDPPAVTTFEASSPGKSGRIHVDWSVSDDQELDSVDLVVSEDGTTVAQTSPDVSGTSADGKAQFENLDGGTYEVEVVVRDAGGSQVSETTTVTVESGGNGARGGNQNANANADGNGRVV